MAEANIPAPPGAVLSTAGDLQREIGRQLLAAHLHLDAAREMLLELRVRVPERTWADRLLPEGGGE